MRFLFHGSFIIGDLHYYISYYWDVYIPILYSCRDEVWSIFDGIFQFHYLLTWYTEHRSSIPNFFFFFATSAYLPAHLSPCSVLLVQICICICTNSVLHYLFISASWRNLKLLNPLQPPWPDNQTTIFGSKEWRVFWSAANFGV